MGKTFTNKTITGKPLKKDNARNANKCRDYFLEDAKCIYCLYFKGKKRGCALTACCCEDIKEDAIAANRIKRERGSTSWDT